MLYVKNLPTWERTLRVAGGLALAGAAWVWVPGIWGTVLAASALGTAVSGVLGFCPACAMVGRKLR
jgi:hypothetical protein